MKKFFFLCMTMAIATMAVTSCSDNADNPLMVVDDMPFPYGDETDESIRPGDDFYRYMLGGWLDSSNPSPSLFKQIDDEYQTLLDNTLAHAQTPLLNMLRSQADETLRDDSANKALLMERLQQLEGITTADEFYQVFATLHQQGYSPIFRLTPYPYLNKTVVCLLGTGGHTEEMLTAFRMKKEEQVDSLVDVYCQSLAGLGFSEERIAEIKDNAIDMEHVQMECYQNGAEMLQRPQALINRRAEEPEDDAGTQRLFSAMGFTMDDLLQGRVITASEGIKMLADVTIDATKSEEGLKALSDYMIFQMVMLDAPFVPSVSPNTTRKDMLRRALQYNRYYKYRLLVESYGPQNIYKQQCYDILERMRAMFIQRVEQLDWMGDATKAEARQKAQAMKFYVGYPEQWNDALTPQADGHCLLATATQLRQQGAQIARDMRGHSIDELEWDLFATYAQFTTDNAFYSPLLNALVILPAWITKPRFDSSLSEATLYATAVTFGHEFCHGFDSSGAQFDAQGQHRNWWQPEDLQAFQAKQQVMIDLFNQLEAYPGQPADGKKTLAENMADYGGIELALGCYKQRLTEQGFEGRQYDEQIRKFIIAYTHNWKFERERDLEQLKYLYEIDTHSACHNRINGMMRLMDDWYRLYDIQPTDKLYLAPEDRVKIW